MPEIDRLGGSSDCIELDFVEREATPEPLMRLSIHLHAAELSLSDTVCVLDSFGVQRARSTVHNWGQKADLQPEGGKSPNHVAVDETVIQLNDQRFWLYAAVDPDTNEFLHVRLFPTRTIVLTKQFLQELQEKHDVADAVFLVDGAPWLQAALFEESLRFQHVTHGNRNAVERVFNGVKRRTEQFANHFRNATPESAENWLQTFAFAWTQLI
ncbi:IS6 family transposase [Halorientalis regularis]|jgi:putative transposase|uniref:Transposase (Or an inactivated derivative) n=1 Tax=Halorientalis regularis TaxID=660518 RepID=A0A1G7RW06_9EURY|nr:IS6 family transposase [Halorientalis regularis]SDG13970.1 Transposase (or an inactivated derivative) [Halorientalis regularis]